jgi:BirA family biotin operon repressor/biotin-[acetyl-CoA-carboxylase] ligase
MKGRGTMGKNWISKKGNLFISLFFEIDSKNIKSDKFSVLNPRIIKNLLEKYSKYKIFIKWPNDLLVKKRKLCGILQEVIEHNNKKFLIIGIGINTKISPKNKNFKSISLSTCSNRIIKNNEILIKIKLAYEKIISNLKKYKRIK